MADKKTNDGWVQCWEANISPWHFKEVNTILEKYVDMLIAGRESCRIFIPLCGKSVDIKWLADKGHTIVGIELSEKALQKFFEEQNVEYTVSPVENVADAELYKSKDGNILLYKADLFAVPRDILGKFEAVWDRGSLVAIDICDRERYIDMMMSLMTPDGKYLLEAYDYDSKVMEGPPFSFTNPEIEKLYGNKANVEFLETLDWFIDSWKEMGHTWFNRTATFITPK